MRSTSTPADARLAESGVRVARREKKRRRRGSCGGSRWQQSHPPPRLLLFRTRARARSDWTSRMSASRLTGQRREQQRAPRAAPPHPSRAARAGERAGLRLTPNSSNRESSLALDGDSDGAPARNLALKPGRVRTSAASGCHAPLGRAGGGGAKDKEPPRNGEQAAREQKLCFFFIGACVPTGVLFVLRSRR